VAAQLSDQTVRNDSGVTRSPQGVSRGHGGPGSTHEYLEAVDSYLPAAGIEYHFYDQLGSGRSDQPDDESLWDAARFVDEVEQVRAALGLERHNFVLYGQSWGAILAIEYALRHGLQLRGLVISNMMASVPAYNAYAERVLMPQMDQDKLAAIKQLEADGDVDNPRYMQLLTEQHYVHHVLRMSPEAWPDPVQRGVQSHQSGDLPEDARAQRTGYQRGRDACRLGPHRRPRQHRRADPGHRCHARHDGSDHLRMMSERLPRGRYLHCPDGSHLALHDDQAIYFDGLLDFLLSLPTTPAPQLAS
jgi:proline iminopeptidase